MAVSTETEAEQKAPLRWWLAVQCTPVSVGESFRCHVMFFCVPVVIWWAALNARLCSQIIFIEEQFWCDSNHHFSYSTVLHELPIEPTWMGRNRPAEAFALRPKGLKNHYKIKQLHCINMIIFHLVSFYQRFKIIQRYRFKINPKSSRM